MKICYLIVFILVCRATYINAQVARDTLHNHSLTQKKMKLKEELGLDKKQSKAIKALNKEYSQKASIIKSDSTISENEQRKRLKTLNRKRKQRTYSLLTPQQRNKLKSFRKEKQLNKN